MKTTKPNYFIIFEVFINEASGGSTVVDHSSHQTKVKGLSPAAATRIAR